jgi:DNA-binding transcriptional MocR family regulator
VNPGATSERVFEALKRDIVSGERPPGTKLEPATLADLHNSSVTPVRDALHRLAGERLVEMRASEGFFLPFVTEPGLRDLYEWNADLVRTLVSAWPDRQAPLKADDLPADPGQATPAFFDLFAGRGANREHVHQMSSANDRLTAPRLAEARIFEDLSAELSTLATAFDHAHRRELLRLVAAYHRRRLKATAAIVRALYR